jgi:hypothetical protein
LNRPVPAYEITGRFRYHLGHIGIVGKTDAYNAHHHTKQNYDLIFHYLRRTKPLCVSRASGDTQQQVVRGIIFFLVFEANPKNGSAGNGSALSLFWLQRVC